MGFIALWGTIKYYFFNVSFLQWDSQVKDFMFYSENVLFGGYYVIMKYILMCLRVLISSYDV